MRNYSKTGGKKGLPGYRTPSSFRGKRNVFKNAMRTHQTKMKKPSSGRVG